MADAELTPEGVAEDVHYCARFGELDDLKMVVEAEDTGPLFNPDAVDENGNTALHKAAANGHLEVCKYLVSKGASYIRNKSGACPVNWAIVNRQHACAKYLAQAFTSALDVTQQSLGNKSLLTLALEMSDIDLQTMLLNHPSMKAEEAKQANDDDDESSSSEDEGDAQAAGSKPAASGEEAKQAVAIEVETVDPVAGEVVVDEVPEDEIGLVYDAEGNVVENPLNKVTEDLSAVQVSSDSKDAKRE